MIEKVRCEYPKCKKEGKYKHILSLTNEKDSSVELPFCEYHHLIVVGGHFKAKIHKKSIKGKKENYFELLGPFREVEIAEQVMGAREMTKKLENSKKDLNKP